MTDELIRLTATQVADLLARGEVSPLELVEAAAARIEATDDAINALPTRCFERARAHARRIMHERGAARPPGWLGGIPIAIKDLLDVAGVRTTYGSPIYAEHVPVRSDLLVERLEANGAIVVAKSNTPEFGAGASTFNDVFGKTRNPWNTHKSVAGSSGGSAAALAAGQVWLANGSDLGGSLRIPASFNAVLGLRPTPGRVANGPAQLPFQTLAVEGPMARTAGDLALLLDAMCGQHPRDPLAVPAPSRPFRHACRELSPPRRLAFSADLGLTAVDADVAAICRDAAARLAHACGAELVEAGPELDGAMASFQALRAAQYAAGHAEHLAAHRDRLKPEVIWNIEQGLALGAGDIAAAEIRRGALVQHAADFFADYDLLLCPAAIVPPFDVDVRYVEEVDGHRFDNYVDWMVITYAITLLGCPALAAPAGFSAGGLPVGLQIVAPPWCEAQVLSAALMLEQTSDIAARLPRDPATP